jgi:hypothetical protein
LLTAIIGDDCSATACAGGATRDSIDHHALT